MSGRIVKSRKTSERSQLSELISLQGSPADMPCTYCFKKGLGPKCQMLEGASRCQECVRRARPCDGVLVASSLGKLLAQRKKLDTEEEEANEALVALHTQMVELQSQLSAAVGRLSRIRKIRDRVKDKSSELFRRGMMELDKEDGILSALDSHEHYVVDDIQSLGVPNSIDWSALGLGDEFAAVGPLVPEPSGETPPEAPCSSAGAS